jgi:hypothetical protein
VGRFDDRVRLVSPVAPRHQPGAESDSRCDVLDYEDVEPLRNSCRDPVYHSLVGYSGRSVDHASRNGEFRCSECFSVSRDKLKVGTTRTLVRQVRCWRTWVPLACADRRNFSVPAPRPRKPANVPRPRGVAADDAYILLREIPGISNLHSLPFRAMKETTAAAEDCLCFPYPSRKFRH